ncbi:MAG: redoxin domain-containing protein, partial [Acidimicrobiia bacterium]|nr:redoxin domain-containing protein [Acidimicrobiia bacterium]
MLDVGTKAPDFSLPNQHREAVTLDDLKGSKSLVVFIPFPFTGTCEAELCMIRDHL